MPGTLQSELSRVLETDSLKENMVWNIKMLKLCLSNTRVVEG